MNAAEIERAIELLAREPNGGLVLPPDATTSVHRDLIIALAVRHRLAGVYALRPFVTASGLMSYGTDFTTQNWEAASYVDRILRGENPADLPVQAPTKYETVVNLKTARALGLTVPPGLLVAADELSNNRFATRAHRLCTAWVRSLARTRIANARRDARMTEVKQT